MGGGMTGVTGSGSGLVSLAEIRDAARRLEPVAVRTPLIPVARLEPPLLVKPESLQPTGSFKLRGAYAAITASEQAARQRGVIAHSSGNHGHAVAYAAALLGVRAVVVVPRTAPKVKTEAIEYYGAELVTVEPTLSARVAATEELTARHGYVLIPPFDDRAVIAGQGTVGLEIAADCPQVGLVLVPVSGGGLISGIAAAVRAVARPRPWWASSRNSPRTPASPSLAASESAGPRPMSSARSRTRSGWSKSARCRSRTSASWWPAWSRSPRTRCSPRSGCSRSRPGWWRNLAARRPSRLGYTTGTSSPGPPRR